MKIGILKECKIPQDYRVPFTPQQLLYIQQTYGVECVVQPSPIRCFSDAEYTDLGIALQDDLSDCDVIFGVKEVPVDNLIPNKTYLFFAHVIKCQSHNQKLMQALIHKNITMIDYETLVDENGVRVVAFGHHAGIVGAYNALKVYCDKTGAYTLPLAHTLSGLDELYDCVARLQNLDCRIMSTGAGGRVSGGIISVLEKTNLTSLSPQDYLSNTDTGVYTVLAPRDYIKRKDNAPVIESEFFHNPEPFASHFLPYAQQSTLYIAGHFWDNRAPVFFDLSDIANPDTFPIDIISDISCDMVDKGQAPIPTTLRETVLDTIAYDVDRTTGTERPYLSGDNAITVTAVDNLPSAIPRDSSHAFGVGLIDTVIPHLLNGTTNKSENCITRATICTGGNLTENYQYLSAYAGLKS